MAIDESHIRILLVEDNPSDALLVEEYLADAQTKMELIHVTTLNETKNHLIPAPLFDVILLDLSLPDADGINLVEEIVEIAGSVPVIVLTGYADLKFSAQSLSKGVTDYLVKDELSSTLLHKSIIYGIERSSFSEKLKKSEKDYRELFELSPEPMMLFDLDTYEFLDVNKAAIKNYGYSKEEFLSMTVMDIKSEDEKESAKNIIQNTRHKQNFTLDGEHRHVKKNGEIIIVEINASTLKYKGKDARVTLVRDVTQKRLEEERLKLLESVVTNTTESVVIIEGKSTEGQGRKILYVNRAFTEMTGYCKEDALGKTLHLLNGKKTDRRGIMQLNNAMQNHEVCKVEIINYKKDGTEFWVNTSMVPVFDDSGKNTHWVAIGRDITRRKEYESQLKESLQEKDVLLSEIHHRVKNNLAMISGLMQLQALGEVSSEVEYKLYDSISRIQTMAAIHELLYQSESFSRLQFSEIIGKLLKNIDEGLCGDKQIRHEIDVHPIELNINQAVPCAIIINEVTTNIYKHAFKERESGKIKVGISDNNGTVSLSVEDNGIGLPSNFDPHSKSTLGLHIIQLLAEQLNADINYKNISKGTRFSLAFEKSDKKGSGSSLNDLK